MPGRNRFSKSRFHERDHGPPRYRPGSGTSPAPGTIPPLPQRLSGCCPPPANRPHIRCPARSLSPPATVPAACCPCLPHIRRPVRIQPRSAPFSLFPSLRSLFIPLIPPLFPAFSSARFPFCKYFPLEICFIGKQFLPLSRYHLRTTTRTHEKTDGGRTGPSDAHGRLRSESE